MQKFVFLPDLGLVVEATITHVASVVVLDFGGPVEEVGFNSSFTPEPPTLSIRNGKGEWWSKRKDVLVAPAGRLAPFLPSRWA